MIGFLGLGRMGEPMALRLARAHDGAHGGLLVWSRSTTAFDLLREAGATVAGSAAEVFDRCDLVALMLANGAAIDEVLGRTPSGIEVVLSDRVVVNMCTVSPEYSRSLETDITAAGGRFVEAPVSGSRVPAFAGELVAMVAGDPTTVDRVERVIAPIVSSTVRCGAVPRATETKLAVNVFLIGMVCALAESMHFAAGRGLDAQVIRTVLDAGPMASAVSRLKLAQLADHDTTARAAVADVLYNNRLILDAAAARDLPVPLMEVCASLFAETTALGLGHLDMITVVEALRFRSGTAPTRARGVAR